jgi:hypothetical protein
MGGRNSVTHIAIPDQGGGCGAGGGRAMRVCVCVQPGGGGRRVGQVDGDGGGRGGRWPSCAGGVTVSLDLCLCTRIVQLGVWLPLKDGARVNSMNAPDSVGI